MVYLSYICFILFIHHSCDSYVLLTASVDDVDRIADQVAHSPVVNQIRDLWEQASRTFLKHYELGNKRSKSHGRQKKATTYSNNQYGEARPLPDVRFPRGLAHAPVLRSVQSPNDNQPLQVLDDKVTEDQNQGIQRRLEIPPDQLTSEEDISSQEKRDQRRQAVSALVDLGRNASVYLRSLQKVLENV